MQVLVSRMRSQSFVDLQMDVSLPMVEVEPEAFEFESLPSESWLPPLLVRGRFEAEVTFVDIDGCIYVHQTKRE